MTVAMILVPAFVLVGLWLLIYSRRRSRMLKSFATRHALVYRPGEDGGLEQELNRAFALPLPLGRDFSRVRDIAEGEGVRLFRVTEALDLNPYGQAQNTHFGRIAVFMAADTDADLFFRTRGPRKIDFVLPGETGRNQADGTFRTLRQILADNPPPCTLSVTIRNGRFLAYLEPLVTGGEKEPDLGYLYRLATMIRQAL